MKLSFKWLGDFMDTSVIESPKSYCDLLTDTGSKVEGFEILGDELENVVCARLLSCEKHPDADKLTVCKVDCGEDAPRQIVTAATNMKPGDMLVLAKAPAKLAGGVVIKAGKLRGVESSGMFCSVAELGLTVHDVPYAVEDGLLVLEEDCRPGDDVRDVLDLRDTVIEFEITSNRQDCFSVIGLARESAVSYRTPFRLPEPSFKGCGGSASELVDVKIEDPLCRRYCAAAVKNVKIAPSPKWMRSRLRAMGVRPINNIVDITNYVMLEYGQPMHAFDREFLEDSKIVVRRAKAGENIVTLDGQERNLTEKDLLICDGRKPVALAGVMGGLNSEINENTRTVIFESANFDGVSVRLTAKSVGMRTESSGRFEKGLDPENCLPALIRACQLVEELGAGEVATGITDVYPSKPEQKKIPFEPARINAFLGADIPEDTMREIFSRLEIRLEDGMLLPPSFRTDLVCFADIAEEVARMWGYNRIESTAFVVSARIGKRSAEHNFVNRLHEICVANGLTEIETYSFISEKTYDLLRLKPDSPLRKSVVISNPLGEDTRIMRTTAVGSMLETLVRNQAHRNESAALYETARLYFPGEDEKKLPEERTSLVIGFYGDGDFYTIKGICESVAEKTLGAGDGALKSYEVSAEGGVEFFHPGRCAVLSKDGAPLMTFGEIHPEVMKNYGLEKKAYVAVIDVPALFEKSRKEALYRDIGKFPAVTRDLAFVCGEGVQVGELEKIIVRSAGKYLESLRVFDIYRGEQVGEGNKSVAFKLVIRHPEKTLTDEESEKIVGKVRAGLEKELGIAIRQ